MKQENFSDSNKEREVASGYKIAAHRERIMAYMRGESIFPVSLELDLTSRCSRACADCPSTALAFHWELPESFVERLFAALAGNVQGLLLTGGEPTDFSAVRGDSGSGARAGIPRYRRRNQRQPPRFGSRA